MGYQFLLSLLGHFFCCSHLSSLRWRHSAQRASWPQICLLPWLVVDVMPTRCCSLMETSPGSWAWKSQDETCVLRPSLKTPSCHVCYIPLVKANPKDSLNSRVARQIPPLDVRNRKVSFQRGVQRVMGGICGRFLQSSIVSFGKIVLDLKFCKCVSLGKSHKPWYNNSIWGPIMCQTLC